jgi:UDPglucose--hexose-1-phosphate uridylyltransferase
MVNDRRDAATCVMTASASPADVARLITYWVPVGARIRLVYGDEPHGFQTVVRRCRPGVRYRKVMNSVTTKRVTTLADGRELIYFDDAGTTLPPERAADARHLDARPDTAMMRQDVLTGEWVSIASARQNRVFLPPADQDPLSPTTASNPSEVPSNYDVAVFENRSPSFGPLAEAPFTLEELSEVGIGRTFPAVGRCEVVCFSPEHEGSFGSLSETRARTVIDAWADRTEALSAIPGVAQVFPFENRGEAIGVTLLHPHGQIYSYPYVTPRTSRLIESIERFGPGMFEAILESERASERVVLSGEQDRKSVV